MAAKPLGMACPRDRKISEKVLGTEGEEESDFICQRDSNSYQSLVNANTSRGVNITGIPVLGIPTTNFTEVFSINNACFVASRWFGL
jgi:hypothetical protein